MNFLQFSFYLFSAILIVAASLVVTVRNPVKAALYLVLVFFSAACIWLTLEAEFLAIVLVLVYVGAVMVLFLFVVMMLDIDVARLREGFTQYLPAGLVIAGVMVAELSVVCFHGALVLMPYLDPSREGSTTAIHESWGWFFTPIMFTHLKLLL